MLQNVKVISVDPELRPVETDIRRSIQQANFTEAIAEYNIEYLPLFEPPVRAELRALILEAFPGLITASKLDALIYGATLKLKREEAAAKPLPAEVSAVTKLRSVSEQEALIVAAVDRVIKGRDLEGAYDLIPQLAQLGPKAWAISRSMLYQRFRSNLNLRMFDRLVNDARKAPRIPFMVTSESIDTHDRWSTLIEALERKFGREWFTARQVAGWFRTLDHRAPLFTHIDPDKTGSLERAIGRALNGKRIEAYRGPLRLVHRIDGKLGTCKWRIETISQV